MSNLSQSALDQALGFGVGAPKRPEAQQPTALTQKDLDRSLNMDLESFIYESEQNEQVMASRQQEGESYNDYLMRHVGASKERAAVNFLDMVLPDDFVDALRGVETRGRKEGDVWFTTTPDSRFMTPQELTGHREWLRKALGNVTGWEGPEPLPPTGRALTNDENIAKWVANGAEGAADWSNISFGVTKWLSKAAQSFVPSAVAPEVAEYVADELENTDLSDKYKTTLVTAAAVSAGVTSGMATSGSTQVLTGAAKYGYNKAKGALKEDLVELGLNAEQRGFAEKILNAGDDFPALLEEASRIEAELGVKLDIIPIAAALQNPVMHGKFNEFFLKDMDFRKKVLDATKQYTDASMQLHAGLVGTPPSTLTDVSAAVRKEELKRSKFEEARQKNLQGKIDGYDEDLILLAADFPAGEGKTAVGTTAQTILHNKNEAIKKRLGPLYDDWVEGSTASGVSMGASQIQSLVNFAQSLPEAKGRFVSKIPLLDKVIRKTKIKTTEHPSVIQAKSLTDFKQEPAKVSQQVEDQYTPKEVKQLKEQINYRIRKLNEAKQSTRGLSPDELMELDGLQEFKTHFRTEIAEMPNGQALLDIDSQYYVELGLPMDKAGMANIDVEVFHHRIANNLMTLTNARNFLEVTGEEGLPVVQQAVYSMLHKKAVASSNDTVNEKQIRTWLAEGDNSKLAQLAGIDVENIADMIQTTKRKRAEHVQAYNNNAYQSTDDFLKTIGKSGVSAYVGKLLKSSYNLSDLNKQLSIMSPDSREMFKTGIRAELLMRATQNRILSETGGRSVVSATGYMNMKEHRAVYTALFGAEQVKKIDSVFRAYDLVAGMGIENLPFSSIKQQHQLLEDLTLGLGAERVMGTFRQANIGILSAPRAGMQLGSAAIQKNIEKRGEAALTDLLLQPRAILEVDRHLKTIEGSTVKSDVNKALRRLEQIFSSNVSRGIAQGNRAAQQEKTQRERREAP